MSAIIKCISSYSRRHVGIDQKLMFAEIFCARPKVVYVNVPKRQAERLLRLPHLSPNGVPVFDLLSNIKGVKINIFQHY